MAKDPELMREVLEQTDRRSYQLIWDEVKIRLTSAGQASNETGTKTNKEPSDPDKADLQLVLPHQRREDRPQFGIFAAAGERQGADQEPAAGSSYRSTP